MDGWNTRNSFMAWTGKKNYLFLLLIFRTT